MKELIQQKIIVHKVNISMYARTWFILQWCFHNVCQITQVVYWSKLSIYRKRMHLYTHYLTPIKLGQIQLQYEHTKEVLKLLFKTTLPFPLRPIHIFGWSDNYLSGRRRGDFYCNNKLIIIHSRGLFQIRLFIV